MRRSRAYLLEILSDFQVTIFPEFGTVKAPQSPDRQSVTLEPHP